MLFDTRTSKRPIWYRALPVLLALGLAGLASAQIDAQTGQAAQQQQTQQYVYPGAEWARWPSPEAAGYSSERLAEARALVEANNTTGIVAVVGGRILFEHGNLADTSYIASVRKSVLSILYGIYVERGVIDLNRTLAQLGIDDVQGLTDAEKQATIDHIITARSGVYHPASNSGDDLGRAPPRGSQAPGTYQLYSNWDFNVAGTIFEQLTGKVIYDALEEDLVRPLGMQDFNRASHRRSGNTSRSIHRAYHMNISARDLARIGTLMLREGNWNGNQIISQAWARRISSPITPLQQMNPASRRNGQFGYGYMWWIFDGPRTPDHFEGAYHASGAGGQFITVVPKYDLVVAHKNNRSATGGETNRPNYFRTVERIIAAKTAP